MRLVSFGDFHFEGGADFFDGDVLWEQLPDQWSVEPSFASRPNRSPRYTGMAISERKIPAQFMWTGNGDNFWMIIHELLGLLNPADPEPRTLVARLPTGQLIERPAIVSPVGPDRDAKNAYNVTFFSESPEWTAQTRTTVGPSAVSAISYGGVDAVNHGLSYAHGHIRLAPSGSTPHTVRQFSITNNATKTLRNLPYEIDFGSATSGAATTYWALLKEGLVQPCQLVNWGGVKAYLRLVIDNLAPGATADYQLLESNTVSLPGTDFVSYTRPAFDISWEAGTTSAAGSTTTIVKGSATWETNQWRGGMARMLTGADAGVEREIVSNTATTITTAAFGSATGSGSTYLLKMSANGKWVYSVRQTERNDRNRGLWWLNRGQSAPSQVRFDVPGGWSRYLYARNDDEKSQHRWTALDPLGGTNYDYFAILNADRIWKGGTKPQENGSGDGVMISMPVEITQLKLDYTMLNPNRTSMMIVGARESGSEAFGVKYSDDALYTTATDVAAQTVTIGSDATQIYVGLINRFGDSMGADWPRDSGTATSATSTTLTDATKAWSVNHFRNATVRTTGGTGVGQVRTVTSHTGTTLTVASWSVTPDATTQYEIILPNATANLQSKEIWELSWDASDIAVTGPAAAVSAYFMQRGVYIGRENYTDDPPYQLVYLAQNITGYYIVIRGGEQLHIDGETMRAWVSESAIGPVFPDDTTEIRALPPGAVVVKDVKADGTERLAEKWIWLKPGTTPIRLLAALPATDLAEWHTSTWSG